MYTVYILRNPTGQLYKGCTENLIQRLRQHNSGHTRWTNRRGPWRLIYKEEYYTKAEALKREKFLKSGKGRELLKNYIGP